MTWILLLALLLAHVLALLVLRLRRLDRDRLAQGLADVEQARARGSHRARLQHPQIDLSRCLGCGTCIEACPEEGVLAMIHGQAAVAHGARCVGHGRCAEECPVGAIALTLGDLSERHDIPALDPELEAVGVPGLFLAGELTGYALIRTALEHGRAVADVVARRVRATAGAGAVRPPARGRAAAGAPPREARPARGAALAPAPAPAAPGTGARVRLPALAGVAAGGDGESLLVGWPPLADEEPLPDTGGEDDTGGDGVGPVRDLVVVGAGPAGLACSLQAKLHGLDFVTLEQEQLGGTVAHYPRHKLVMTQPVELPLHGRLTQGTYSKEELMELWSRVAREQELPIVTGQQLLGLQRAPAGHLLVRTVDGVHAARHVCLALGRRGSPRKLGVPGEELPKVAYGLLDARAHAGQRVLVVGGGDSAVEAAVGLSEQEGCEVTLSYRKAAFFRLKARNEKRLGEALAAGRLSVAFSSQVVRITPESVVLTELGPDGSPTERSLANDTVIVLAGGVPPFGLLQEVGVSFDPADRPTAPPLVEQGPGLRIALRVTLLLVLATLVWTAAFRDYYGLPATERFDAPDHALLRPSGTLGLPLGIGAALMIVANLAYLVRRGRWGRSLPGSLRGWMSSHVVTGILGLLLASLHAAMAPRATVGGHAFLALAALVATGAVGRYFYAFIPRAANGRELQLDEVRARLAALSSEWDAQGRGFGERVRALVDELAAERWKGGFVQRVLALVRGERRLHRVLAEIEVEARQEGLPPGQVQRLVRLGRRAHRSALMAGHYDDLRALLASWRWLHRWAALLMVLLLAWHVATALRYGGLVS